MERSLSSWKNGIPTAAERLDDDDDDNCGFFFGGINGVLYTLLRDFSPRAGASSSSSSFEEEEEGGGDMRLGLPVPPQLHHVNFTIPHVGAMTLQVRAISLLGNGLYQWDQLQLLEPMGRGEPRQFGVTLQTPANLTLQVDTTLVVSPIPGGIIQGDPLTETFQIQLNTSSLSAMAVLELDVERSETAESISVGTLIRAMTLLIADQNTTLLDHCLLQPVQAITATQLQAYMILAGAEFATTAAASEANDTTATRGSDPLWNDKDDEANGHHALLKAGAELEQDLDALLNHVLQLFLHEYQPLVTQAVVGLMAGPVRNAVNAFFDYAIRPKENDDDSTAFTCPDDDHDDEHDNDDAPSSHHHHHDDDYDPPHNVNFTNVKILQRLNAFLRQNHTLHRLNRYMDCSTNYLTKSLQHEINHKILVDESILQLKSLQVENEGSVNQLQLCSPTEDGMHLENTIGLGSRRLDRNKSTGGGGGGGGGDVVTRTTWIDGNNGHPRVLVELEVDYEPLNVSAAINITMGIDGLFVDNQVILHYDLARLENIKLLNLLASWECGLVPVGFFDLQNAQQQQNLSYFDATVHAVLTSQRFFKNKTVVITLDASNSTPHVQTAASELFQYMTDSATEVIRFASRAVLARSDQICENSAFHGSGRGRGSSNEGRGNSGHGADDDDENEEEIQNNVASVMALLFVFLVFAQPGILMIQRPEGEASTTADGMDPNLLLEPLVVHPDAHHEDDGHVASDVTTAAGATISDHDAAAAAKLHKQQQEAVSLMSSPDVPSTARVGLPVFIMVATALLFSSNLGVGATVDLSLMLGKYQQFDLPGAFSFSLINTAKQMWMAGIYPLFFLVTVFSGVWPYTKLFLMMYAFLSDPAVEGRGTFTVERRGNLVLALDALGKFSLVDAFVMVLFIVAFRVHVDLGENAAFDVFVTPHFAFYGFILATSASLVAGHVLVYYHRRARYSALDHTAAIFSKQAECVFEHVFSLGNGKKDKMSRRIKLILLLLLVCVLILLFLGITRESFTFAIGGLAGLALGDDERFSSYSLWTLGSSLPESFAKDPEADSSAMLGAILLQGIYFFYTIVTPISCLVCLLLLLIFPLTLPKQMILLTMAEVANSWASYDVFALSVLFAITEISTFASFMVGHHCDFLDYILKHQTASDFIDGDSLPKCFTVEAKVKWDALYLIAGVLLNSFWVAFVLRLCRTAANNRYRLLEREQLLQQHQQQQSNDVLRSETSTTMTTDSATTDDEPKGLLLWLSTCRPMAWLFFRSSSTSCSSLFGVSPHTEEHTEVPPGPPVLGAAEGNRAFQGGSGTSDIGADSVGSSPRQDRQAFEQEWKEDAERDPSWKEWKETTNVT